MVFDNGVLFEVADAHQFTMINPEYEYSLTFDFSVLCAGPSRLYSVCEMCWM